LSRLALDAVDLAIREYLVRRRNGRRVVIDLKEGVVYYQRVGRNDRLGSLEKRIVLILVQESLSEAEIARRLGVWHQAVHDSLARLRRKGLVESWTSARRV